MTSAEEQMRDLGPLVAEVARRREVLETRGRILAQRTAKAREDLRQAEARVRVAEESEHRAKEANVAAGEARRARRENVELAEEALRSAAADQAVARAELAAIQAIGQVHEEEWEETQSRLAKSLTMRSPSAQPGPSPLQCELSSARASLATVESEKAKVKAELASLAKDLATARERAAKAERSLRAKSNQLKAKKLRLGHLRQQLQQKLNEAKQ